LDPKPGAPAEVRGPFSPIATSVPGIEIGEHFSRLARHFNRVSLVRSLTHDDPAHLSSAHLALTGNLAPVVKSDDDPPSERDTPHMGSVLASLMPSDAGLPPFVTMPWLAYHPAAPGGVAPGQHGGFIGKRYDPMLVRGDPNQPDWRIEELSLPSEISLERLDARAELLRRVDEQRRRLDLAGEADLDTIQQRALSLVASSKAREAFDLGQEPDRVRDAYGRNIHGQCVLLARRLIERGVRLVSVNWHDDGKAFWDTHDNNFNRLKDELIPPADQALSALLLDLADRGLLDGTIVAWVGEFGRKPQVTEGNSGREHWPYCYSGMLAGGGIAGGRVHGASDKIAALPTRDPVRPQDFSATLFHALGIRPSTTLVDNLNRPRQICHGEPLLDLFA
jgi:hypothetical protein